MRICQRHGHGEDAKTVPPDSHFEKGDGPAPSGREGRQPQSDKLSIWPPNRHFPEAFRMTRRPDAADAGIVVFEKQPYWGPELKRQFSKQQILVRECRSVSDLYPNSDSLSRSVLLLSLDAAPTDCLTWMGRQLQNNSPPFVVVASPDLMDLEWPIREAGAAAFVHDEIAGDRLARLCRRLLSSCGERADAVNTRVR